MGIDACESIVRALHLFRGRPELVRQWFKLSLY